MATITIRIKQAEFDVDPVASKISRFGLSYDLVVAGVATPQVLSVTPDAAHEFHLWAAMREVLKPLLDAMAITPPPRPTPERTSRLASAAMGLDPALAPPDPTLLLDSGSDVPPAGP